MSETTYVATDKNETRADAVEQALELYSVAKGEGRNVDCDTVRDFFQDVMHWEAKRRIEEEPEQAVDYEQVRDAVQELFETAYGDFPYEADGTETDG